MANIYLQNWVILEVNVGKYVPYMDHMGHVSDPVPETEKNGGVLFSMKKLESW